jgi:hypothetical protein
MTEVDWLLDQFAQTLDERDQEIAQLRARLAAARDAARPEPQQPVDQRAEPEPPHDAPPAAAATSDDGPADGAVPGSGPAGDEERRHA